MISLVSSLPAVLVVKVVGYPSGNQNGKLFLNLSNNFLSFWSQRWSEPLPATKPGSFFLAFQIISCHFGREGGRNPFRQPNREASCKTFRLFWSGRWWVTLLATKPGSGMQRLPAILVVKVVSTPFGNQTGKLVAKPSGYRLHSESLLPRRST